MKRQAREKFYRESEERLNALAVQENGEWVSKRWNREIKGVLVQLGQERAYRTCAYSLPDGIESDWGSGCTM